MQHAIDDAKAALDNTPNLLPVLKEAGVVDAGGAGLVKILEGAYHALSTGTLVDLKEAVKIQPPLRRRQPLIQKILNLRIVRNLLLIKNRQR